MTIPSRRGRPRTGATDQIGCVARQDCRSRPYSGAGGNPVCGRGALARQDARCDVGKSLESASSSSPERGDDIVSKRLNQGPAGSPRAGGLTESGAHAVPRWAIAVTIGALASGFALPTWSSHAEPLAADAVASWPLDERSGAVALDDSGNGHTGTLVSGPGRVAGKVGGALSFRSGSYVSIPDLTSP
jgi:hypothetical protein